jgi:hypothetical protein
MEQAKISNVAESADERAQHIADIRRTSFAVPPATHGAFDDLYGRLQFIKLAGEALRGIASMMRPEYLSADEPLNETRRSDAAAIFRFFGEALEGPAGEGYTDLERLERAAKGELV